jgi:hypothetical protein
MDLLQLRVIERVLAVIIGGMSIYLGYRLFIKVPRQKDTERSNRQTGIDLEGLGCRWRV